MQKPTRMQEPFLERKQKANKKRKLTKLERREQYRYNKRRREEQLRERGTSEYELYAHVTQYTFFSDEDKEKQKQAVTKSIMTRFNASPRFRKRNIRKSHASTDKNQLNRSKICTICKKEVGLRGFDKLHADKKKKNQFHNAKRRPYCMDCRKKMNREYYLKNKEKWEGINDNKKVHREQ